jgi:endonuclease YncB( thermonuclease family)
MSGHLSALSSNIMVRHFLVSSVAAIVVSTDSNNCYAMDLHGVGTSVKDGDQFMLCENDACTDIRLCGLDTPSRGKRGYDEAIATLSKLVVGKKVLCRPVGEGSICDGMTAPTSRGRTVAQCFVDDDTVDVAAAIIAAGLGCDRAQATGGHYSKDNPKLQCATPGKFVLP